MKKTVLAVALSALFAGSAMADPKVYGNFRASMNFGDLNGADNGLSVVNNASRLGVKGSSGTDSLKGIYHIQMGANNDAGGAALSSRFYFAGLKGSFGKVIYGRLSTPYKMAGVKQDPFYDTSAGSGNGGSNYGYSGLNNGFTDNSIAFYSSKIGGAISVHGSLSIDDSGNDDHDIGFGAEFSNKMFKAGVSVLSIGDDAADATNGAIVAKGAGVDTATRVYGSAKLSGITVGASFETVDTGAANSRNYVHVNGSFKVSSAMKVAASFGSVTDGNTGTGFDATGTGFSVGAFYNVLPKTRLSAIFSSVNYDDVAVITDRSGLSVGVVQSF
ncbi:MAG: porin [Gammaproteobacteria bacterium]|nr:porin [Gammaproteobacteria bacterium]